MNTENQPTEFQRSPEFFVAEVAHRWVSETKRQDNAEISINRGQKIDPEKGVLYDLLEIRIAQQMERVEDPAPEIPPMEPIPAPVAVS